VDARTAAGAESAGVHYLLDKHVAAAGAKCIADELARARAPLFRGDPVSVEMTWYVP